MIPVFISVRTSSRRLPKKCLMQFGDGNVLEHIIKRVKFYEFEPIICTTDEAEDNVIVDIARKEEVKCFRGSKRNKIKRWADCCEKFDIEKFHTIGADNPFFDDILVRKSMCWLDEKRVDVVYPNSISSKQGSGAVEFSLTKDILLKTLGVIDTEDTEMMWKFLEKVPGLRFARLKSSYNPPKARLTLDYIEDYIILFAIERLVGTYASRREVVDVLLKRNPDLHRINWFRNKDWRQGQIEG
jgi:spore coat polysaccharide biosynthesis protein SpsF